MSVFERIMDQACEMFVWLDYQGVHLKNTVQVSRSTFSEILKDLDGSRRYVESSQNRGFQAVQLQTAHGNFMVEPNRRVDDDDLVFTDVDGFEFSYRDSYVSHVAEKILLGGNGG